jgi:hypothetical protein
MADNDIKATVHREIARDWTAAYTKRFGAP